DDDRLARLDQDLAICRHAGKAFADGEIGHSTALALRELTRADGSDVYPGSRQCYRKVERPWRSADQCRQGPQPVERGNDLRTQDRAFLYLHDLGRQVAVEAENH